VRIPHLHRGRPSCTYRAKESYGPVAARLFYPGAGAAPLWGGKNRPRAPTP
jgi:hypothetical protein